MVYVCVRNVMDVVYYVCIVTRGAVGARVWVIYFIMQMLYAQAVELSQRSQNILYTQNEALGISTGCHKMSSVDHLHAEANMLKVKEHSELQTAQYLARCLEPDNVNFSITTSPKRMMKETLCTRHRSVVEPLMIAKDRKTTLQAIYTMAVNQSVNNLRRNVVLDDRPPVINISEKELTRKERTTLAQLRSGHCRLLQEQNQ